MEKNNVLFDDWQTRHEGAINSRKRAYTACMSFISILFLGSCLGVIFELALVVPLVLSAIVFAVVFLEWCKVKNNHLIIKHNEIQVTNRFNQTTYYKAQIHELTLESVYTLNRRSGGIVMKFYDTNGRLICKYEDIFNRAAPWGFEKTDWENHLERLGIKIVDTSGIIKN